MAAAHNARINLKLRELSQLFNSMDPSPFIDRDLDHDAEEFIVSSAREAHGSQAFELVIHLETASDRHSPGETEDAVRHYFSVRAELKRREFRRLLRRGHSVLVIGLLFLSTCLLVGGTIASFTPPSVATILKEGLNIVGWVAMWKPLEIYLYEWWPLREEWRALQRLSRMRVRVVPSPGKPGDQPMTPVGAGI